ncbi:MAG: acyl-CoA dehydrogenase [Spongiibacter sp.]|nr:acyl-CoA dehydrogenase [Spongiibacter sp.]
MTTVLSLLLLVAVLLGIFAAGLSRRAGAAGFTAAYLLLGIVLTPVLLHPLLLLLLFAVLAVLLIDSLRIRLISQPAQGALKKMMPPMSATEKEALEAGTTWWEKDLFSGKPDWRKFAGIKLHRLSQRERAFLDGETEALCAMLDEWQIHHELKDLPEDAWQFIKDKGFLGLIIPEEYGGLHFSPYAQSRVLSKIASRSSVAAVSVMVPNSLGPGELLAKYGTDEQKSYWLPRLARGEEIPCFGLTSPEAGSDAGAIPDNGVVCRGTYDGEEVLGIRLNLSKRWITLAPIATVVGLAFKLRDPDGLLGDQQDLGICCALVPAGLEGMEIGRRHNPGAAFMNGPITGRDVFIPMDLLIGGQDYIGRGWQMLVECLGAGRGISLPALSTAAGESAYLLVGAFARIRRQFGIPVGKFEGVQEASVEIAASAYTLEAYRAFVTRALDDGAPSVLTAMAKYHATEMMRQVVNLSMDILGGRGIQLGPRNFMALTYQVVPIGITVEGANILTRSMIIFGQGAMRCHPYLADELAALDDDSPAGVAHFDQLFTAHIGHTLSVISCGILQGLGLGWLSKYDFAPPIMRRWYRRFDRLAAVFAATADIALATLGGDLKRREMLSARLGDVHSQLVIASALIKFHSEQPHSRDNDEHAEYALQRAHGAALEALDGLYRNFPQRWLGCLLRVVFFPLGLPTAPVTDEQRRRLGDAMLKDQPVRRMLAERVSLNTEPDDAMGRVHATFALLQEVEPFYEQYLRAEDSLPGSSVAEKLEAAVKSGIVTAEQAELLARYDAMRYDCLLTDAFDRNLESLDVRPNRP